MLWLIFLTPILLILGVILWVVYMFFVKIYIDAARYKKMDPNLQVYVAPFSGVLKVQKQCLAKHGDSHYFAKKLVHDNPDTKAYLSNLGYKSLLILCDAELVKYIVMNPKKTTKVNLMKHGDKAYNKGIIFVDGNDWSSQRSIISHSFNYESLKSMVVIMRKESNKFFNSIENDLKISSDQRIFKTISETQQLISKILLQIFFSDDAEDRKINGKSFELVLADYTVKMYNRSRTGQNILMELFFGPEVVKYNFTAEDKNLENLIFEIRKQIVEIIDARIKTIDTTEKNDFLSKYIKKMNEIDQMIEEAEKEGKPHSLRKITKDEIIQQVISIYFAGIDTTSHLVAMAVYALAEYPEYREKLKEEAKLIKTEQDLTYENLQKLQYFGNFLNECLRMWPPGVGLLARIATEDLSIGPYKIKKGDCLGTNFIGLMNNPKYFKEPGTFNPERWNEKSMTNFEPYSFIPFSAGSRSCIGKYLALAEAKLIIIQILQRFDVERTEVPLRMHAPLLYQPVDENLVYFKKKQVLVKDSQ